MKKCVFVEFYCGEQGFNDEIYLTFDESATEEDIKEAVSEEFDRFIDDVVMETCTELFEDEYEYVRAEVANTSSCEWRYLKKEEIDEIMKE